MTQDELKQQAAQAAFDYVMPRLHAGDILGIGTGSTTNHFIQLLGAQRERFAGCVASSTASADLLRAQGIAVVDLNTISTMRFYVDGADEANARLELIKGGGAALTREKIVAACAGEFVCIADESKWVTTLGKFPLPVEIIPMAKNHVIKELVKLGGQPVLREDVVTDNGGLILDVHKLKIGDPLDLELRINQIVGVVTNGLFAQRPADRLLLGTTTGVREVIREG